MLRKTRRSVQFLSLLFIVLVPFFGYLNSLRSVYGISGFHVALMNGGWLEGNLYAFYERTFGLLDDPVPIIDSLKGTFWSITILGFNISDPLAGIGYLLTTKEVYFPILLSILIPVLLTVILGRVFCGWVCPINTIAEITDKLRKWVRKKAFTSMPDINLGTGTKYGVLAGSLAIVLFTGAQVFAYFLPYVTLGRELHNLFYFHVATYGAYYLLFLLLFELLVSRRGWCRYLCPSGALLSLMSSRSWLKLVKDQSSVCADICQDCNEVCQMGLNVRDGKSGAECSQCGDCVVECPQSNLKLKFSFSKTAVTALAFAFILFFAPIASAHHMSGLPHYGYSENYPQIPVTEQEQNVGGYTVSLTSIFFQGVKRELSSIPFDSQFYVHIYKKTVGSDTSKQGFKDPFNKDKSGVKTDAEIIEKSYAGVITLVIMNEDGAELAKYTLDAPSEEAVYRFRHYFKRSGTYGLAVNFSDGTSSKGQARFTVPIAVTEGVPTGIYIALLLLAVLGVALYLRKKSKAEFVPSG